MIIGKGLIASIFTEYDRENVVFFASGVSNSLEIRKEEFLREENLLRKILTENPEKIFVYFSSCSIYDSSKTDSMYVNHKLRIEQIVEETAEKFLILRVSNAVGKGGNPNLLMNYLVRAVVNEETINVYTQAARNLIDTEDIKNLALMLLDSGKFNRLVNIAYLENFSTIEILESIETNFNKKVKVNLLHSGQSYRISIPDIHGYFIDNQKNNKEKYLKNLLIKYYSEIFEKNKKFNNI